MPASFVLAIALFLGNPFRDKQAESAKEVFGHCHRPYLITATFCVRQPYGARSAGKVITASAGGSFALQLTPVQIRRNHEIFHSSTYYMADPTFMDRSTIDLNEQTIITLIHSDGCATVQIPVRRGLDPYTATKWLWSWTLLNEGTGFVALCSAKDTVIVRVFGKTQAPRIA